MCRVLAFYLAALIFGLGLFVVQLLSSHDAAHALPDADAGGAPPVLGDGLLGGGSFGGAEAAGHDALGQELGPGAAGHEVEGPAAGALVAHGHAGPRLPGVDAGLGWLGIFTSLRFYMFAAIGLGVVGAPVTAFGLSPAGPTLAVALLTAFGLGTLASLGFRLLGRQTLSSGATQEELVGHVGRVLVACERGRRGKVRLTVRGQTLDFVATTDETRIEPGMAVIVEAVEDGRLHVCAAPSELLPE